MLRFVYSFVVKIFNYVNHVRHRIRKYTSCACCTGQGNDFELIPMVRMESQHSVGVPTCHDFPRFVFRSQKSLTMFKPNMRFSEKKTPYGQIFKNVFQKDSCEHRSTSCVQISWNLATGQKNLGTLSHSHFCADCTQNLSGTAPDNILGVPQISSKSVYFRRSYSRTRELRWNAPQSISNTRRSFFAEWRSFFAE